MERNFSGIQFEALRRAVDPKFNELHDALTAAYYQGKPFSWRGRDFGVLDKARFEKLHGLVFHLRDLAFHQANLAQPEAQRIPEARYNELRDEAGRLTARRTDLWQVSAYDQCGNESELSEPGVWSPPQRPARPACLGR